jgi:hypothetical protein
MAHDNLRTRKQKEELLFDSTGAVCVEDMRECRKSPTEYEAPPGGSKWWAETAVFYSGLSKAEMVALAWLIDHANPTNGRCDPSQACGAWETGMKPRTLERALCRLRKTRFLKREQRGHSSNAYFINWAELRRVFDAWQERKQNWSSERDRVQGLSPVKSGGSDIASDVLGSSRGVKSGGSDPVKSGGSIPSKVADKPSKEPFKENLHHKVDGLGESPNTSSHPHLKIIRGFQVEQKTQLSANQLRKEQEARSRLSSYISTDPFLRDRFPMDGFDMAVAAEIEAPGSGRDIIKTAANAAWLESRRGGSKRAASG